MLSGRMFTAKGKPFSTSLIMGAGSTSTLSSMAIDKSQSQRKKSANGSGHCKQDPRVTHNSKNTLDGTEAAPFTSLSETPIATSSAASNYRNANNNNTVRVNGGRKEERIS